MASASSIAFSLVLLVALCLLHPQEAAATDCRRTGRGCFGTGQAAVCLERQNRKMLAANFKEKEAVVPVVQSKKLHEQAAPSGHIVDGKHNMVGWELRKVPSGPDPLHHNGNTPKKPRTDP